MGRDRRLAGWATSLPPSRAGLRWPASLLAVLLLAAGAQAPAASGEPVPPDLVSDPPGASAPPQVFTDEQGDRLLLRFDGFVHNRGLGPLELRGFDRVGTEMTTVVQRIKTSKRRWVDHVVSPEAKIRYEPADGHDHWHLGAAVRYSLWTVDRSAEAAPSQKVGFCLVDSQRVDAHGPVSPTYTVSSIEFCREDQPATREVLMGISAGWRDVYGRALAFQWVDISDVAPGEYWLRSDADPDGLILETDELNDGAFATSTSIVNGYLARPVDRGTVSALAPSTITLKATRFDDRFAGGPGALEFKIVTPPAKGTLDRPVGVWFSGADVRYLPHLGASGPDSFTFAARDASSAFPRTPRTAAVSLTLGGLLETGSLAVSGAPQQIHTSTATHLDAIGSGSRGGVAWRVNGIPGGDSRVGTISPDGEYVAPATVPAGGRVVVSAVSPAGARALSTLRVVDPPVPRPAPLER